MDRHKDHERHGFTLVELLVVIGIVTLLAAIIMPSMATMKERARLVLCLNRLRQIGIGHLVAGSDNKGQLPYAPGSDNFPSRACKWGNTRWVDAYSQMREYLDIIWGLYTPGIGQTYTKIPPGKYLSDYRVFYCPGWTYHLNPQPGQYVYDHTSLRHVPDRLDKAFYLQGSGPGPGNFHSQRIGYEIFASGHPRPDQLSGDEQGYECPKRLLARKRPLRAGSYPLCWIASDMASSKCHKVPENVPGFTFPYNVIHLDGHADTHQVDPFNGMSGGTVRMPGGDWQKSTSNMPYGNTGWNPNIGIQKTGLDTDNDKKGS
jgi:prepilin-type N-terminal cleavage/methylation domain-containing protein